MKIRWVQLSDIHYMYSNYDTNRMRLELEEFLKNNPANIKSVDYLLLTGDLTDKSSGYTNELFNFIESIRSILNISKEKIQMIPGNHDINRNISKREELLKKIYSSKEPFDFVNDLLTKDDRQVLLSAQSEYFKFYEKVTGNSYPEDNIHIIHKFKNINFVLLNTSWLCGSDDEEGKIVIGMDRVLETFKKIDNCKDDLVLVLGHHPLGLFSERQKDSLLSLFNSYNIDLYLSGHTHKPQVIPLGNTIECICGQQRVDSYASAGFVIGQIDIDHGHNLSFFRWNAHREYWTYDNDVNVSLPLGIYSFPLVKYPIRNSSIALFINTMGLSLNGPDVLKEHNLSAEIKFYPSDHFSPINIEDNLDKLFQLYTIIKDEIKNKELFLFPVAQIYLLLTFGCLLQNTSNKIHIYQYNDELAKWIKERVKASKIKLLPVQVPTKKGDKCAIVIEVSSTIDMKDVEEAMGNNAFEIFKLSLKDPKRNSVIYEDQVKQIKNTFKTTIESILGNFNEFHMFYSGPAGLAIELGRCMQENMWPEVILYDFNRRNTPKYTKIAHLFSIIEELRKRN